MKSSGRFKIFALFLLCSIWLISLGVASVRGTTEVMNYQGLLKDSAGRPVSGTKNMVFAIYDAPTNGNLIWTETQAVAVESGIYHVLLGAINPLSADLFSDDNRWLEVAIEGETLTPRLEFSSAAFAFKAKAADDADTVDGFHAYELDQSAELTDHLKNPDAHHSKTTSFSNLTDTASDAQIPNDITINHAATSNHSNTADTAANADMVDGVHAADLEESAETDSKIKAHKDDASAHHPRYTDAEAQAAAGHITTWGHTTTVTNLNADMLDGKHAADFASSDHNHDERYYTKTQINALITQNGNGDVCIGKCQ